MDMTLFLYISSNINKKTKKNEHTNTKNKQNYYNR